MAEKILVVDDDLNVCELLRLYLTKAGYEVYFAHNGDKAMETFGMLSPDLVVLDVMLPGKDGFDVCRRIRLTSKVPIIMLTAKGELDDKLTGLDYGADDYLVKPFEIKELVARVKALLRRYEVREEAVTVLNFDKLVINISNYTVTVDGKQIELPPKELELLFHLASNPNTAYTRDKLLDEVWGYDYFGDSRTVDVHIKRLRSKLNNVSDKWEIKTIWGVGYEFSCQIADNS